MNSIRFLLSTLLVFALVAESNACSFCTGSLRSKQTLRVHHSQAKLVVHGQLKNPRFDPVTDNGFTDLHITTVLKDDPARAGKNVLTLPKYLPVIGNTPTDYLVFCSVVDSKLEVSYGVSAPAAVIDYLKQAAKLEDTDPARKLGFYFQHLDSKVDVIAADAFFEFARANDTEILKAASHFQPATLRKLIENSDTPVERLGVFAFVLGSCGGSADAAFLGRLVRQNPLPEHIAEAFGGLLAGYLLLAPQEAWPFATAVLAEPKRGYAEKLSVIATVRFFQATRADQCKAEVLKCCATILNSGDLADQAVEDLRRWGYWELTPEVFAQFEKPSHNTPVVRRSIVRYAISCPLREAKTFLDMVRKADPKLVKSVEEALAMSEPPPKKPDQK